MVRPEEKRRPQPARAGFTLMEMMVVVTIIAVTAGLAAPAMYQAFAERRASSAPIDLVRLVRRARSEAQAYGRAYSLRFDGTSPGSFTLWRGSVSACGANDWTAIQAEGACGTAGTYCVDQLDMSNSYYSNGALDIRVTESDSNNAVDTCFEPTGRTLWRSTAYWVYTDQNLALINGGFIFNFQRYDGSTPVGVARQVVIPHGGDARVLR